MLSLKSKLLCTILAFAFANSLVNCAPQAQGFADEFVLSETSSSIVSGDFNCSTFNQASQGLIPIVPASNSMTTGELWSFFNKQGVTKLEKLVLCLDVSPTEDNKDTGLSTIDLTIGDSMDPTQAIERFSLDRNGDNSILLPGYETSSFRPEAQFEIQLGFDFMSRYSESSTEKIMLNVEMDNQELAITPAQFYFAGQPSWFASSNFLLLVLFATFWALVFIILFRLTNPGNRKPKNPQALSA